MKKTMIGAVAVGAMLVLSAPAMAVTLTQEAVGGIDTLIAEIDAEGMKAFGNGSSPAVEEAWVEKVLGENVTFVYKNEAPGEWFGVEGEEESVFATLLSYNPEYFVVKTGQGEITVDGSAWFLFQNEEELLYAVINLESMGFTSILNITGVSHITEFNPQQVAEPGTLLLLGSGLLGLGLMRRKRNIA